MTPAEFKLRFPLFAAESDARIQLFIDDADAFFNVARWGGYYVLGLGNLVAHNLLIANSTTLANALSSSQATVKKVGDVQVTYSSELIDAGARDPFMRTTFGQQYLFYLRQLGAGIYAV